MSQYTTMKRLANLDQTLSLVRSLLGGGASLALPFFILKVLMVQENENPIFPYVKFRAVKRFISPQTDLNGKEEACDYILRVDGVHNNVDNLMQHEKRGHIVVGFGNLDNPKFNSIRNLCEQRLGMGATQMLYKSVMDERVQKAKDDKARSTK